MEAKKDYIVLFVVGPSSVSQFYPIRETVTKSTIKSGNIRKIIASKIIDFMERLEKDSCAALNIII